ncbi:hypothetical protein [Pararhizobium arenae]|uniref:hypothetical protein n=1 Tax=Pararhizobium arenae TaxID=1856850 RepID=UPI00094B72CC|nr:hypothetical protein [Pararhizobium arenae]
MTDDHKLPRPPESISIECSVRRQWESILELWRRGWHSESAIDRLEDYIEFQREKVFVSGTAEGDFDWEGDWLAAVRHHDLKRDFVANRRAHNDDLRKMWSEWLDRNYSGMANLALEALRSMVLINGASILACLTLLSGQISTPSPAAVLAAKVMIFFSIVSLIMMAGGHVMAFVQVEGVASRVRGVMVGHMRHRRLYAVSRYVDRFLNRALVWSSALIYGSIFLFAFSALISAIILITGSG